MADKDEKPTDDELEESVDDENQDENSDNEESETLETDNEAEESSEEEATDEDSEDDESEEETEEEESKFEKRFPRFKGDTPEEYLKNLEEGYAQSSQEAVRLARENKELKEKALSDIANDDGADPKTPKTQDPNLAWAEQEREKAWQNDWKEFAKLHPEVEQDETLFADFDKKTGDMFAFIQQTEGRMPSLAEAMQKTWAYMHPDEPGSKITKEERLAMAAKDAGAGTKSKGIKKEPPKSKYTDKQIETAKKFDPALRNKSRAEIEEILDKYK